MDRIVVEKQLGAEGVLKVVLPLGATEASLQVRVTIEPVEPKMTQEEWQRKVMSIAGRWQGEFERPPQLPLEERDPMP